MIGQIRHFTPKQFRDACQGKKSLPPTVVVKTYTAEVEDEGGAPDGPDRTLVFTISTGAIDRDGDTVSPEGWDLGDFKKSGVVLWAHNSTLPPIAKPIETWTTPGGLKSRAQFTPADMNHPLGEGFGYTVYRMFQEGYLKGVSVGFLPKTWKINEERGGDRPIDFERQSLLEFSAVPIPSNPEAIIDIASKGIDVAPIGRWCEMALDDAGTRLILDEGLINDVRKMATGSPAAAQVPEQPEPPPTKKAAITYDEAHPEGDPLAPVEQPWDGPRQVAAADVAELRHMATWVDAENPDAKGSYKLPHHQAGDNHTVWRGVAAAMGALLGSRGGVEIPGSDRRAVYDHLARHYREFEKEPPEYKEAGDLYAVAGDDGAYKYESEPASAPRMGNGDWDRILGTGPGKTVALGSKTLIAEVSEALEILETLALTEDDRKRLAGFGDVIKSLIEPDKGELEILLDEIGKKELEELIRKTIHQKIIQPLTGKLY